MRFSVRDPAIYVQTPESLVSGSSRVIFVWTHPVVHLVFESNYVFPSRIGEPLDELVRFKTGKTHWPPLPCTLYRCVRLRTKYGRLESMIEMELV